MSVSAPHRVVMCAACIVTVEYYKMVCKGAVKTTS